MESGSTASAPIRPANSSASAELEPLSIGPRAPVITVTMLETAAAKTPSMNPIWA